MTNSDPNYEPIPESEKEEAEKQAKIFSLVSYLGFVFDFFLIGLLLWNMMVSVTLSIGTGIALSVLIVLIYFFSLWILGRSKIENKDYWGFTELFAWLYILLSALILAGLAYHLIYLQDFNLLHLLIVPLSIFLSSCGITAASMINRKISSAYIPYILAVVFQLVLWVIVLINNEIKVDLTFIASVILFLTTLIFIYYHSRSTSS